MKAGSRKKKRGIQVPELGPGQRLAMFLLLAGICFTVYYNGVQGRFVFDDSSLVQTDDRIQKLSNIPKMLNPFSPAYLTYRPVRTISYAIDYYFTGDNPVGYHLSNIIYHSLCAWLIFLIFTRLVGSWQTAFMAALLFAVHPINTEAVTYISGRRDVLSTLFFLLGFICFMRYRESQRKPFMLGVLLFYVLGVLSKEMAITLPAVLFLYDWYSELSLRRASGGTLTWGEIGRSVGTVLGRYKVFYGLILGVGLFFVYYYLFVTPASTNLSIYWGGSLYTTFLTTTKIFAKYLQLVFLPITLIADYNSGGVFPLGFSIFEPTVFLSMIIVGIAILASIWLLKTDPPMGFGGLFFFITLLPVSHLIPHHELISEHFLYLPTIGICLFLSCLVRRMAARSAPGRWSYVTLVVVLLLFSWRTVIRNRDWKDESTLWTATLRDAPLSVRAHTNLGLVYLAGKEYDRAIEHFEKSLTIPSKPELGNISDGRAMQNLGVAYMGKKNYPRALQCFQKALEMDPKNYVSYINMGVVRNRLGENLEAVKAYQKALDIFPSSKEAVLNLAIGYQRLKNFDAAFDRYRQLIKMDRGSDYTARAHYNMGFIYNYYLHDYEQAGYHFEIARKMNPDKYPTKRWLGTPVSGMTIETPSRKSNQPR